MPDAISGSTQAPLPPPTQQPQTEDPREDRQTTLRPEQRTQAAEENERPEPRRPGPDDTVGTNIDTTA